jgi:septal ring factor EnvC (AmiA/AmiB activator)
LGALEDTQTQLDELLKLREAHRRRLAVLQVQAAQHGNDTPPHIVTEQEDIDRQLTAVNQKISLLSGALPSQQRTRSIPRASSPKPLCRRPLTSTCW